MSIKSYIEFKRKRGERLIGLTADGLLHKSADSRDIEILHSCLKLAITYGTDKIKVVAGEKPNTWIITILGRIPNKFMLDNERKNNGN